MAFSEISEFRDALAVIPHPALNSSERSLLWVVISYPDGCFIGQEKLAFEAGMTLSTSKTNLGKLYQKNLLRREQSYARRGVRQNWSVNMEAINTLADKYDTFNNRVRITAPKELVRVRIDDDKGANKTSKGANKLTNGSDTPHPYREYKDYKYDKELFLEFMGGLKDQSLVPYIEPGINLDNLLNEVIRKDTSFKGLHAHLSKHNINRGADIGGLIIWLLNDYLGHKKPKQKDVLPWCGRDGCNPDTRKWSTPSKDINGRDYYECNKCNAKGIAIYKETKARKETDMEFEPVVNGWNAEQVFGNLAKKPE